MNADEEEDKRNELEDADVEFVEALRSANAGEMEMDEF